jgi:hypothetical protein
MRFAPIFSRVDGGVGEDTTAIELLSGVQDRHRGLAAHWLYTTLDSARMSSIPDIEAPAPRKAVSPLAFRARTNGVTNGVRHFGSDPHCSLGLGARPFKGAVRSARLAVGTILA